jgi:hypothetical protein
MALGAQRSSVYRLILKEAGGLIGAGVVIGLGCSVAAATLIRGLLFGVRTWDVPTLAAVARVLGISSLLASLLMPCGRNNARASLFARRSELPDCRAHA